MVLVTLIEETTTLRRTEVDIPEHVYADIEDSCKYLESMYEDAPEQFDFKSAGLIEDTMTTALYMQDDDGEIYDIWQI